MRVKGRGTGGFEAISECGPKSRVLDSGRF